MKSQAGMHAPKGLSLSLICIGLGMLPIQAGAQRIVLEERVVTSGSVISQQPGLLRMTDENGKQLDLKYQGPDEQAVSLGGATAIIKFPAKIEVHGTLSPETLKPSQFVKFEARVRRGGRFESGASVQAIELLTSAGEVSLTPAGEEDDDGFVECSIVGQVISVKNNRLPLA